MQAMRGLAPSPRPHPPELLPLTLPCRFTGSQQLPWDSLEGRGVWGGSDRQTPAGPRPGSSLLDLAPWVTKLGEARAAARCPPPAAAHLPPALISSSR